MVAATFPNLSFENPPGTGPTVLSGSAEPYAFADGALFEFTFAGITEAVVFLTTDFVDIGAATADEVAALIEARVDDIGAANDGGFVRLTSQLTGEDIEIDILGGTANAALNFPLDSVNEWAEWADENGRPEEVFEDTTPATQTVLLDLGIPGGAANGPYTVSINGGAAFPFIAAANTRADVIAGLIPLINGGAQPVTAAPGPTAESMLLIADVPGDPFTYATTAPAGETWTETDVTAWLVSPGASETYDDAIFDSLFVPAPFERFVSWLPGTNAWGENLGPATGLLTSVLMEAAAFVGPFAPEPFEPFEYNWGSPTYFEFVTGDLLDASVNPETFETSWGNPFPVPSFSDADFANGTKSADDFEGVVPTWYTATIVTAAPGEWKVIINGITHLYTAGGGDTALDIATGLVTELNGSVIANVSQFFNIISIWPVNTDLDLAISVVSPSGGAYDLLLAAETPGLEDNWVGQDTNPDFD
jgi:hypothetical protein